MGGRRRRAQEEGKKKKEKKGVLLLLEVELPHDLVLASIVPRLPLLALARARCVCRGWRRRIFSSAPRFFSSDSDCLLPRLLVPHATPQGPCLAAFDPSLLRWFLLPTPPSLTFRFASGGLFLFSKGNRHSSGPLVVGNPITNLWIDLPPLPCASSLSRDGAEILLLLADPVTASFKVILLLHFARRSPDHPWRYYLAFLYDSHLGAWQNKPDLEGDGAAFTSFSCIVQKPHTFHALSPSARALMSYDSRDGSATFQRFGPLAPPSLTREDLAHRNAFSLPCLLHCNGRLFQVAGLKSGSCTALPSLGIWVMRRDRWELLSQPPRHLFYKAVHSAGFVADAPDPHRDCPDFFAATDGCDSVWLVLKGSSVMLEFHVASTTWHTLPGCPANYEGSHLFPDFKKGFYEPLLSDAWLPSSARSEIAPCPAGQLDF